MHTIITILIVAFADRIVVVVVNDGRRCGRGSWLVVRLCLFGITLEVQFAQGKISIHAHIIILIIIIIIINTSTSELHTEASKQTSGFTLYDRAVDILVTIQIQGPLWSQLQSV